MSTIVEIERAIQSLPPREVQELRDWIENYLDDELALTDEFEAKLQRSEQEMRDGKGRARNLSHPA